MPKSVLPDVETLPWVVGPETEPEQEWVVGPEEPEEEEDPFEKLLRRCGCGGSEDDETPEND